MATLIKLIYYAFDYIIRSATDCWAELLKAHVAFPCCKDCRHHVQSHKSSKARLDIHLLSIYQFKTSRQILSLWWFLLSSMCDPCLVSSPPSLCNHCTQHLPTHASTTPSLLLSAYSRCWFFFCFLLVEECSVLVSLQHPSKTLDLSLADFFLLLFRYNDASFYRGAKTTESVPTCRYQQNVVNIKTEITAANHRWQSSYCSIVFYLWRWLKLGEILLCMLTGCDGMYVKELLTCT